MELRELKNADVSGYTKILDDIFINRRDYINSTFSDLYSGKSIFTMVDLDEKKINRFLKKKYNI